MSRKELSITSKILLSLCASEDLLSIVFASPYEWRKRILWGKSYNGYRSSLYWLYRHGYITFVDKNNQRFLKITKRGEIEALIRKMNIVVPEVWDKKWRVVMFDIPEESSHKRDQLRRLLKQIGFYGLQASVFIHPYPLNREAVVFLKKSKLTQYIHFVKVEEMDDDKFLRKHFKVS